MEKTFSPGISSRSGSSLSKAETISLLNGLIQTCKDGEAGFRHAAGDVTNPSLKALFNRYSVQRADFAAELQDAVRRLGGDPEDSGTLVGALRRGWEEVKATFTARDDDAILEACEQGEDATLKNYEEAVAKPLPADMAAIVTRQADAVRRAHDQIRDLCEVRG